MRRPINLISGMRFPIAFALIIAALFPAQAQGGEAPGAEALRAFLCDPALSSVTYTAVHPFATVHGVSHAPACTVWVNPDTTEFRVRVSAPARSFKSGIGLRDTHAMKAVEADKFPLVEFSSATVKPKAGKVGPYFLTGQLAFHGETHSVEMTAKPELKDGKAIVRGGFPISLAAFKVKPPSLMMTTAKDTVAIAFDLIFDLKGAK